MPMTGEEFGAAATGAAALLTIAWAATKDKRSESRSKRSSQNSEQTDRLALALDGFDRLVADMRSEIDRGRSERAGLYAQITDLLSQIDSLRADLANRDLEIAILRDQVRVLTEKAQGLA